jgi:uncharacterized membrane protein YgdD (TMEM256/DUF423 family)
MTPALCLRIAAVSGLLAVALGAFGAHALKPLLEHYQRVGTWETAVLYHMFHTLALLGLASRQTVPKGVRVGSAITRPIPPQNRT